MFYIYHFLKARIALQIKTIASILLSLLYGPQQFKWKLPKIIVYKKLLNARALMNKIDWHCALLTKLSKKKELGWMIIFSNKNSPAELYFGAPK